MEARSLILGCPLDFKFLIGIVNFGFLTSLTMVVALIGDIFLLPVLLKLLRPIPVHP